MPKFGRKLSKGDIWKELFLTFIATTLSIVLTFGTAYYLDNKAKKATGRQTAMMVIHDMETSINDIREMAKNDATLYEVVKAVIVNPSRIDSLSEDSLYQVVSYLMNDTGKEIYRYDDANERVFLSSQDSWKNIDNPSFTDAVQKFYLIRHEFFDEINNSQVWKIPIDGDMLYKHMVDHQEQITDIRALLKHFIGGKEVKYYLSYSSGRQYHANRTANSIEDISNYCKFTMGITDEELEEYVKSRERTGDRVKERKLLGKWTMRATDELHTGIEFFDDYTCTQTSINHYSYPLYDGQLEMVFGSKGTWKLRGDSLDIDMSPKFTFKMDRSKITPKPGAEKAVEKKLQECDKQQRDQMKELNHGKVIHVAYFASINSTGNKIELVRKSSEQNDKEQEMTLYLSREQ